MVDEKAIPVRVALRVRPLVPKEISEGCQHSITFVPGQPQVVVGQDKGFTFDYVFPCDSTQQELYSSVADRIDYLFKGYNVTVLAYGQTGSGKTYTMGTSYCTSSGEYECGIIQRAVQDIFRGVEHQSSDNEFLIKVSFLEVYKEDVFDLLQKNKDTPITIREDQEGIKIVGLTEQPVTTAQQTYQALEQGSLSRTTASTAMNARSSRSHAIFTIILEQRSLADSSDFKRAKFHLVDLAGSERANKTGALGERFKEGVNINRGLLALGNVISALCDDASHVPYRDSKLTRLLQDSLGGNSHTIMIACVSPADSNLDETINTLRYADRARKIKNKPIINRDPQNAELMRLRQQVQQLQVQLLQNQGVMKPKESSPNLVHQKTDDVKVLLERNQLLETENSRLAKELQHAINQTTALCEKAMLAEISKEKLVSKMGELQLKTNQTIEALLELTEDDPKLQDQLQMLREWQEKIVEIQCDQIHKDHEFSIYSPARKAQLYSPDAGDLISSDSDDTCGMENVELNGDANLPLKSTLKQAAMNRELQELEHALARKEEIALKMRESNTEMTAMRIQYENCLKQMEEEINNLQKEKEELSNALKAVQANSNASKVSEQRRKRLQELETKISEMKRQIQEKARLLKMKQEAERKVSQLTSEIQNMKAARVKLLKQIREEAERYRTLKAEKEREVTQLKQKDRKRQYEMCKLQDEFQKQKNVLKRKMEEATAANKRLNEALKQQKSVAERRSKEKQQSILGIGTRVQQWLSQELEVVLSSKVAQHHSKILMEDRKTIVAQINLLRKNLENNEPPEKKRNSSDEETDQSDINEQISALEKEFQIRNVQIADFQRQISDVDQDEKMKHRWESIQSMVEAKCAMKWLFETATNAKFEKFLESKQFHDKLDALESELSKTKQDLQKICATNEKLQTNIRSLKSSHADEMAKLVRENEDKTIYLLKQLNNSNGSVDTHGDSSEKKFLESEIERLGYLLEENKQKDAEIKALKEKLSLAAYTAYKERKPRLMNSLFDHKNDTVVKEANGSIMMDFLDESYNSDNDDDITDPDWVASPLIRKNSSASRYKQEKDNTFILVPKASTSMSGCACKFGCSTKRCKCRKQERDCSELCKCNESCANHDNCRSLSNGSLSDNENYEKTLPCKDRKGQNSSSQSVLSEINRTFNKEDSTEDFIPPLPPRTRMNKKHAFEVDGSSINDSGIKKQIFHDRSQRYFEPFAN